MRDAVGAQPIGLEHGVIVFGAPSGKRYEAINSRFRSEADAIKAAKADEKVAVQIAGKDLKKAIYVPGRLVSLVV